MTKENLKTILKNKHYLEGMAYGIISVSLVGIIFIISITLLNSNITAGYGIFLMFFILGILSHIVSKINN